MAGLIIYGKYGQFNSFIIADDKLYKMTIAEFKTQPSIKLCFKKGEVSVEQIDKARGKTAEIVKKLNDKQKIDVEKELSDYFD